MDTLCLSLSMPTFMSLRVHLFVLFVSVDFCALYVNLCPFCLFLCNYVFILVYVFYIHLWMIFFSSCSLVHPSLSLYVHLWILNVHFSILFCSVCLCLLCLCPFLCLLSPLMHPSFSFYVHLCVLYVPLWMLFVFSCPISCSFSLFMSLSSWPVTTLQLVSPNNQFSVSSWILNPPVVLLCPKTRSGSQSPDTRRKTKKLILLGGESWSVTRQIVFLSVSKISAPLSLKQKAWAKRCSSWTKPLYSSARLSRPEWSSQVALLSVLSGFYKVCVQVFVGWWGQTGPYGTKTGSHHV